MLKEERFQIILKALESKHTIGYEEFSLMLGISEDTARRDVDYLCRNGLLTKVRGGAMLRIKDPLSFQERTAHSEDEKNTIALKTQKFIKNDITIFMDGGTTICTIVKYLPIDVRLRIITNNQALIPIVAIFPHIELILLGGTYDRNLAITLGTVTCNEVRHYVSDVYFMGTCAIHKDSGATSVFNEDAAVKRSMVKSSKKIIVLAEHNKIRRTEPFRVAEIDDIDVLITDLPSDRESLDCFRNSGIEIV